MELDEAIKSRRSIRKYNGLPVSNEDIRSMIEAAIMAPSACNNQCWRFIVIDDSGVISQIQRKGGAEFLKQVHQGILVLYDNQTDNLEYLDYIESASAAIENMLLKATEIGVGACWVNNLPNKRVLREILSIPTHYDPIAMVTIGHYDRAPRNMPRKYDIDQVISYNKWIFEDVTKKNLFALSFRRFTRKIYKRLPFKEFVYRIARKYEKRFDN